MIQLINVKKHFDGQEELITNGVNLLIEEKSSLVIIGLSGEGKSVLLKQIAGLIRPTSGSVIIDGVDITRLEDDELAWVHKRCGYVFQFAALLDSMTVYENIALPLLEAKYDEVSINEIVEKSVLQVNLDKSILFKYPSEISGGMKKRVGLARTLVLDPIIILYDEPTSGLDPINTRIIHELIRKTQIEREITTIVISHDVEVFKYVDNVAFLYEGKIVYFGKASEVWGIKDPFIKQFIRGLTEGPIL